MKSMLISLILCSIFEYALAQFSLSKISNPDTVFSSTWKTDLIKTKEWNLVNEFTEISGTLYSTTNEGIKGYEFKFFDSTISVKLKHVDSTNNYSIIYSIGNNSFLLKLPLYMTENKITHVLFSFKLCFFDSSLLLIEELLQPIFLDENSKKYLFRNNIMKLNRRAFPYWALYPEKDWETKRKFLLFKRDA